MSDPLVEGARRAGAAERNREPILQVLSRFLPARGTVLEIASGTGQHVVHFAAATPGLLWQPSERDPEAFPSIEAWTRAEGLTNVLPPVRLDVTVEPWPIDVVNAIFNANMIHISPWAACLGLMRGAGRHLVPGGKLYLYGPFKVAGAHTAPSNAAFDLRLRGEDPSWGVRDLEAVVEAALTAGMRLEERIAMPANNQTLVFARF
jgi:hypothetical protein